jgi:hypothetical protein
MTQTILDLIAWVNRTALSVCDTFGVNPMGAVTVVAVVALIIYFAQSTGSA